MQPEAEMKLIALSPVRIKIVGIGQRFRIEHARLGDGEDRGAFRDGGFVGFTAPQDDILLAGAEEIGKRRLEPQRFEHEAVDGGRIVA